MSGFHVGKFSEQDIDEALEAGVILDEAKVFPKWVSGADHLTAIRKLNQDKEKLHRRFVYVCVWSAFQGVTIVALLTELLLTLNDQF